MTECQKPLSNDHVVPTFEYRLPKTFCVYATNFPRRVEFKPLEIIHVVLGIEFDGNDFVFSAIQKIVPLHLGPTADPPEVQVKKFASALHTPWPTPVTSRNGGDESPLHRPAFRPINPYDITPVNQCYIVLELSNTTNWFFHGHGVTTKQFYSDSSFGVVFVKDSSTVTDPGELAPSTRSRVLYFSVAERVPKTAYGFNFHIEFLWKVGFTAEERSIPLIFDPNVPNDGGSAIIPP